MSDEAGVGGANRLQWQGRLQDAEMLYREVLSFEPDRADALINLAVLLEQQGRREEAIRLYENGIGRAPCLEFYVNLGALWISEKRPDCAIAPLQKAVELAPACVPAHVNLAGAHSMLGNDAEALASYRKALELEPDNLETLKRFAAFLGTIGRTDDAVALYRKLLAARPSVDQFLKFGNCLMAAGRTPEAAEAYRRAVALDERDARSHFSLANAFQELTDVSSAQQHFARASELQPGNPWWRLRAEMCGPVVFESREEIEGYCERVERAIEDCRADSRPSPPAPLPEGEGSKPPSPPANLPEPNSLHPNPLPKREGTLNDILEAGAFPTFGLSYLGRNVRRLKEQFAAIYEPCFRDCTRWSSAFRRSAAVTEGNPAEAGTPAPGGKGDSPIFDRTYPGVEGDSPRKNRDSPPDRLSRHSAA